MKMIKRKIIRKRFVVVGAIVSLLGVGALAFAASPAPQTLSQTRLIYSQSALLGETWANYKADYIENGSGRTVENHSTNVTTSLGQSYTMLRSVWIDDKATFDKAYDWSNGTLRLEDGLFASQFGPVDPADPKGSYGVTVNESDPQADTNTALALLMAYRRWNDTAYLNQAKPIIAALYEKDITPARTGSTMTTISAAAVNPAAYKEFAKVDPTHDWAGAVTESYAYLSTIDVSKSDNATAVFNLGLDYAWNKDPRALAALKSLKLYIDTTGSVFYEGAGSNTHEVAGKLIAYTMAVSPAQTKTAYQETLAPLYSQDLQAWNPALDFKTETWVWLGTALYDGKLIQLTEITQ